jgi:hypothetical protein
MDIKYGDQSSLLKIIIYLYNILGVCLVVLLLGGKGVRVRVAT